METKKKAQVLTTSEDQNSSSGGNLNKNTLVTSPPHATNDTEITPCDEAAPEVALMYTKRLRCKTEKSETAYGGAPKRQCMEDSLPEQQVTRPEKLSTLNPHAKEFIPEGGETELDSSYLEFYDLLPPQLDAHSSEEDDHGECKYSESGEEGIQLESDNDERDDPGEQEEEEDEIEEKQVVQEDLEPQEKQETIDETPPDEVDDESRDEVAVLECINLTCM